MERLRRLLARLVCLPNEPSAEVRVSPRSLALALAVGCTFVLFCIGDFTPYVGGEPDHDV